MIRPSGSRLFASVIALAAVTGCESRDVNPPAAGAATSEHALADSAGMIARNLAEFDTLDFEVFSKQQWDRLKESHHADIIVSWPDGHDTRGLDRHIEDLKAMFVALPDLKIEEHPIRIANGSWTAVTGRMTGTFTAPMPLGGGKVAQPTGRKLDMTMATIGHWTTDGVMDHEWLFWDNQTFMRQLGLAE
jgi:predicted ester cyclase